MSHSFDVFVLIISIASEIYIHHILTLIIHKNINLRKLVDNIYCLL